jgi:hypothetical protein
VYAAMAACSGGGAASRAPGGGDAGETVASEGGQPGKGGAPSSAEAGEGMAGSPVPNAMAAGNGGGEGECGCQPVEPKEPTVVEAECGTEFDGSPLSWAVAEVDGAALLDLARAVAVLEYSDSASTANKLPEGFNAYSAGVYLKDGSVAASCGPLASPGLQASRVRFVLP